MQKIYRLDNCFYGGVSDSIYLAGRENIAHELQNRTNATYHIRGEF